MIFERSLIKELVLAAAGVVLVITSIMVSVQFIRLLGQAAGGELAPEGVIGVLGFGLIRSLPTILCLSVFVAILMTLTRMYRDHEMVIWHTAGLGLSRWIGPVLRFTVPVALLTAAISFGMSPWAAYKSMEYQKKLESLDEISTISPGEFRETKASNKVYFVEGYNPLTGRIKGVFAQTEEQGRSGVMAAQSGYQKSMPNLDQFLVMENGRRYEGTPGAADYRVVDFERYFARTRARESIMLEPTVRELSTLTLLASRRPDALGELWWRLSLPIGVVLLGLVAVPLSYYNPRVGQAYNLVVSLLVFAVYMNMLSVFQALVITEKLNGYLGMLPVHVGLFGVALAMYHYRTGKLRRRWREAA